MLNDLSRFSESAYLIYLQAIDDYHRHNDETAQMENPFSEDELAHLLYAKCLIDTIQWHKEDDIRDPDIDPAYALQLKREIDRLNQERTNIVELIDNYFLQQFVHVRTDPGARINSESPAWAIDRLSILALKIFHMEIEVKRTDASPEHIAKCARKLEVLREQQKDLCRSINELLLDIAAGNKCMKVYRQMKMYNDPALNPVIYNAVRS